MNHSTNKTAKICNIGLMASLVLVSTFLKVHIPLGSSTSMIHLGNVMCLLSGFILGPLYGGLAAGIGSLVFDLLTPIYITSAPFTFAFKFVMSFTCGAIAKVNLQSTKRCTIAAILGSLTYIVPYLIKSFIKNLLIGIELHANLILVCKVFYISVINAALAIIIAVPLFNLIREKKILS